MTSIRYLRNKDNHPWATIIGIKDRNGIKMGYSICCPQDKFSKKTGRDTTFDRVKNGIQDVPCIDSLIHLNILSQTFPKLIIIDPRFEAVRKEVIRLYHWLSERKAEVVK